MIIKDHISIQQFCEHYEVPTSFIVALYEFELIELVSFNNDRYLKKNQIQSIEKLMRLHFDLNINLEGIDAIYNLLKQVEFLQQELNDLTNRLRVYED